MASSSIPDVRDTDLDRDDLVEAAEEVGLEEPEALDDQQLLEAVGARLGEVDGEAVASNGSGGARGSTSDRGDSDAAPTPDAAGEDQRGELESMTRDELRAELRELGLPVSGNKGELLQRLEAARAGAEHAARNGEAPSSWDPAASPDAATRQDAPDDGTGQEPPQDDAAEQVTADREQARDRGEYRVEEDPRDEVVSVLDVELGPLALDLLGLEIHLHRVHVVLTANPEPKHALLGKLLVGVATVTDKLGVDDALDQVTDGVESVVDALPTPDVHDDGDDEDGPLSRLGDKAKGAARSAKEVLHKVPGIG